MITAINMAASIIYHALDLISRIVPAIGTILFGEVLGNNIFGDLSGGDVEFFNIDVAATFHFLSVDVFPIFAVGVLIGYASLSYYGNLGSIVGGRAKPVWAMAIGCVLPAWVMGYTGFTTHAWYNFIHVIPISILFSQAGVACVRTLREKAGDLQKLRDIAAHLLTILFVAVVAIKALNIVYLNTRLSDNVYLNNKQPFGAGTLPRYDLIKELLTRVNSEIHLKVDDYSRRTYVNIHRLDQLSDVHYDFFKEGRLRNYSKIASPQPAIYTSDNPCIFIQERTPSPGAQGQFKRFKNFSGIIRHTRTQHFDVYEYKPRHVDFCFNNTRIEWINNANQNVLRKNLRRLTPVVTNTEMDERGKSGSVVPRSHSYSIFWSERGLPWFISFKLSRSSTGEVVVDAVLDSDLLSASGAVVWDIRHQGRLFSNATLRFHSKDGVWETPFVRGANAEPRIFGLDKNDDVEWLSYFPIRLVRASPIQIDDIRKIELQIEMADGLNKVFKLWHSKKSEL